METTINQLVKLTGKHHNEVTIRLDGLPFKNGPKNSKVYNSVEALARIYGQKSLDSARAEQTEAAAALARQRLELLRSKHPPVEEIKELYNEIFFRWMQILRALAQRNMFGKGSQAYTKEMHNGLGCLFHTIIAKELIEAEPSPTVRGAVQGWIDESFSAWPLFDPVTWVETVRRMPGES